MEKRGQKVFYHLTDSEYAIYQNQTITNIVVDSEGYCEGEWRGKFVAAFSLLTSEWYII